MSNVVVLGAGHSGTRIVTRMLEALGWNLGDVKEGVAEHRGVQETNKAILMRKGICPCGSDETTTENGHLACHRPQCQAVTPIPDPDDIPSPQDVIAQLPEPFVLKEPRMVVTWSYWALALQHYDITLLHIERDSERMKRTYTKYHFPKGIYGHSIEELKATARRHYAAWDGPKLSLRYEDIARAVELFDLGRAA